MERQARKVERALARGDVVQLRKLAAKRYGLVCAQYRAVAWPLLLSQIDKPVPAHQEMTDDQKRQISVDSVRTFTYWPEGINDDMRENFQTVLLKVLEEVFSAHPELFYYQGYNEIVGLLQLVMNDPAKSVACAESLAFGPLQMHMCSSVRGSVMMTERVSDVLRQKDRVLYKFLWSAHIPMASSILAWVSTWCAHQFTSQERLEILFDYLVANADDEDAIVYVSAAALSMKRKRIMAIRDDFGTLYMECKQFPEECVSQIVEIAESWRHNDRSRFSIISAVERIGSAIRSAIRTLVSSMTRLFDCV